MSLRPSVAAVDLGSNSFHMVVARIARGELETLDRDREMVRLAAGLDRKGVLSSETQERAIECLQRFGQRLRNIPASNVRVVATNTLRRARNRNNFLRDAQEALGHPIAVISGIEEARLVFLGVARSLGDGDGRRLVVDIGGGSTELIVGEQSQPLVMESLYMGCVALSRKYFSDGRIDKKSWQRAHIMALQELEPVEARFRNAGWTEAAGSSGTIRAIGRIVREAGYAEEGIPRAAIRKLRKALLAAGSASALEIPGLSAEREPVFAGGVVILEAVFDALGVEQMEVADGALREGVLYDLLGRIRHEDTRSRTVEALSARYHLDREHSARVEATALHLLEEARETWKLDDEQSQQVLGWAARLHEIGLDIAHAHYHKHGGYIIANADLPGFSLREQEMVATLVQAHRRKLPISRFEEKPASWLRLAILLRIAALLQRSRAEVPLPYLRLDGGSDSLHIHFPDGWLAEHPLTEADLKQEANYLRAADFSADP